MNSVNMRYVVRIELKQDIPLWKDRLKASILRV